MDEALMDEVLAVIKGVENRSFARITALETRLAATEGRLAAIEGRVGGTALPSAAAPEPDWSPELEGRPQ
jgi:hypothetical protein